jgi:hypothetical protein
MEYTCWRHAVFALRLLGRVFTSFVALRLLAGGRPAATPFSCFAKKRKQKKSLPYGFPPVQVKKWEMKQTRLRLRQLHF